VPLRFAGLPQAHGRSLSIVIFDHRRAAPRYGDFQATATDLPGHRIPRSLEVGRSVGAWVRRRCGCATQLEPTSGIHYRGSDVAERTGFGAERPTQPPITPLSGAPRCRRLTVPVSRPPSANSATASSASSTAASKPTPPTTKPLLGRISSQSLDNKEHGMSAADRSSQLMWNGVVKYHLC